MRKKGKPRIARLVLLIVLGSALLAGIAAGVYLLLERQAVIIRVSARIRTDMAEIAGCVDLFNADQDTFKFQLIYSSAPFTDIGTETAQADIVIGKGLFPSAGLDQFQPLDRLFDQDQLSISRFYPGLLELGREENSRYLLPVSFDLPAIMFRDDNARAFPALVLPFEEIRRLGGEFNVSTKEIPTTTGFSPRWDSEFLYILAVLFGASFRVEPSGSFSWNHDRILEAIAYARSWIDETNGGLTKESFFAEKYLYDPGYKLIREGRIRFALTGGAEFFLMPDENKNHLDIRWISGEERIPVSDRIVFMGIPRNARNRPAAEAFIRWFFSPEVQRRILESNKNKRIDTFGVAGGFSTLVEVNELVFPQVYPLFIGHIPPQSYFQFPTRLPDYWEQLKKEVLSPWLLQAMRSRDEAETNEEALRSRIRAWRLAHGK